MATPVHTPAPVPPRSPAPAEGGRPLGQRSFGRRNAIGKICRLHLVSFGEHDLMAHRRFAQHVQRRRVGVFEAVRASIST
jgi:hypothetical protein